MKTLFGPTSKVSKFLSDSMWEAHATATSVMF
jgi:hypothetical protein